MMLALTIFFSALGLNAQTPAELGGNSYSGAGSGPVGNPVSGRMMLSSGSAYTQPKANVTVFATITNQQYTGVNTGTGNPVLMFGATNGSGGSPVSRPIYAPMDDIGSPTNSMFSNLVNGSAGGIDVTTNQAFNMYTSVHQWAGTTNPPVGNRTYVADLTLTFSTPLTNPMLQLVGLGGTSSGLGFTDELDLVTPGLTFTKLQGDNALSVTSTRIANGNSNGITASCTTNGAACGTVRLNGNNIQSVTFKVYVRGDSGSSDNWGTGFTHAGDQWLIGVSIPETFNVSGNVYKDTNGMGDNTVNGTGIGTAGVAQLYANLVEPVSGKIIASVPVASNGTYSFDGVPGGANVRVEISQNGGTELATAPAKTIPNGWIYTGDHLGAGPGSEASPNGAQAFQVLGDVTNVNFGLNTSAPTAAGLSISGRVITDGGSGIRNVVVTLSDAFGSNRSVKTGPLGFYQFSDIPAGQIYVVSATAKNYAFAQSTFVVNLMDDMGAVDFIGLNIPRGPVVVINTTDDKAARRNNIRPR